MRSERERAGRSAPAPAGPLRAVALGALALLATACIGDNPIDLEARSRVFGLLGGLEVGEALTLEGGQARRIALPGNLQGAEYVVIPFMATDESRDFVLQVEGATRLDAVAPPVGRFPSGGASLLGRPDVPGREGSARFHERLRRDEIARLEPSLRSARPGTTDLMARRAAGSPARVPVVGDVLSLRTINDAESDICESPLQRDARVVAVSSTAVVVSDTQSPAELSDADFAAIAAELDALVHPVTVSSFGAPTDIDGNARVIVFFTPVANDSDAAGFFFAGDLFSVDACAASNEAEVVYVMSPDPLGTTRLQIDAEEVAFVATDVIAHEIQHLINASRRIYVNDANELEEVWLNEGLSHIAEELVFYEAAGFGPGENIGLDQLISVADLANRFVLGNHIFYATFAANPWAASLTGDDGAPTRGAMWAFLRYAADHEGRPGTDLFYDLVNSRVAGLANLNAVLETGDALDLMQAFTASVYADDHVDGLPDFLTQPSWNFRSALPAIIAGGEFPVDPGVIQPGQTYWRVGLDGGSSAFFQIRIPPEQMGELQLTFEGQSAGLRVTVIRIR